MSRRSVVERAAIIDETERLEAELNEAIDRNAETSTRRALELAKQIVEFDGPRAGCETVDRSKVEAAVRELRDSLKSKLLINKPINDAVRQFQTKMKDACIIPQEQYCPDKCQTNGPLS